MVDIDAMTAEELDELIHRAMYLRAAITDEPQPADPPSVPDIVLDPCWRLIPQQSGSVISLRHPGFGWVTFMIPRNERALFLGALLHQALLQLQPDSTVPFALPGKAH